LPVYPSGLDYYIEPVSTIPSTYRQPTTDEEKPHPYYTYWRNGNLKIIGKVRDVRLFKRKEHSLRKQSVLYDILKQNQLPIDEAEKRFGITNPTLESFYKDSSKYDRIHHFNPDYQKFMEAIQYWQKRFQRFVPCAHVMTTDEAIKKSDINTSPGFPPNKMYHTKKEFILNHTPWLKDIIVKLEKGELHDLVIKLADKVEIRENEKILEEKIRTFAPIPIEFHVLFMKYFGAIADAIQALDPTISHNCAGWSQWYGGWNELMKNFEGFDEFIDLDARKFDGSIISKIRELVWEFFWAPFFLDPKERAAAKKIYFSMMNPYIITPDGFVFQLPNGGRFSGELLTLLENSLINLFIYTYCALRKGFNLDAFFRRTMSGFMGDDILAAQYSKGQFRFTAEELISFYHECNIELHEGGKFKNNLQEVSFLSLTPLKINNFWVFYPDIEKVIFSLSVAKESSSKAEVMQKLCILYAYAYFCASKENVDRIKQVCVDYVTTFKSDNDVVRMYYQFDIQHIARMFFPMRHISAARLINQADKSSTSNNYMNKLTIHEQNPLRHRDISGKNNDRPKGIDLSGRGIPQHDTNLVGKPLKHSENNVKIDERKNPLHNPKVDSAVRDAYAAYHRIQDAKGTEQDKSHFDEETGIYPYNFMGPYVSDGKFTESVPIDKHTKKPTNGDDTNSKYHDGDYSLGKKLGEPMDSPFYDWADSNFLDRIKDSKSWMSYLASGAIYASKTLRGLRRLIHNKKFDETDIKLKISQLENIKHNEEMPKTKNHNAMKKKRFIGPKMSKKFAKKRAKKQMKRRNKKPKIINHGMVFNKPNTRMPRSSGSNTIRRFVNVFLDSLVTTSTDVEGQVSGVYPINPQTLFPQMEAGILASFYERWTCHRWRVCYKPSTVNTTPGDFWIVPEPDVTDNIAAKGAVLKVQSITDNLKRIIIPYQGGVTDKDNKSPWFKPLIKSLWTSPNPGHDPSQVYAGSVTVGVMQPSGVNLTTGQLFLEMDMSLHGKFLDDFSNSSIWQANPTASAFFGAGSANSVSGRYQNLIYPTPSTNLLNFTVSGRFLIVAKIAESNVSYNVVSVSVLPKNGTVTINNAVQATSVAINSNGVSISEFTVDITGATPGTPAIISISPASTPNTTIAATMYAVPIDGGAALDKLVKTSRTICTELEELKDQMAQMRLLIESEKEKPLIEISNECNHKRSLYEPLSSYQTVRKQFGDDLVDRMDDTSIQFLLKNFNMAPKLSQ